MSSNKTSQKPKVKKFRCALINAENHETMREVQFSRMELTIFCICTPIIISAIYFILIALTPIRACIPGYPDARARRIAIENTIRVDSLQRVIGVWELYSANILRALEGEAPLPVDEVIRIAHHYQATGQIEEKDSLIRRHVREEEQFALSSLDEDRVMPIEGMHFFTPVRGVISQRFTPSHQALDIATAKGSVIKAALDGTVIYSGYDEEQGYILQIQHESDLVTIYKHCSKLLKSAGDTVSAGTAIGISGSSGSLSSGDHLHLEFWYKGKRVDPELYINL